MPNRHSLFWKLAILLVGFCLLMIGLSWSWGRHMETQNAYLSDQARITLTDYAAEAERAWKQGGQAGVDAWMADMASKEGIWVNVLGPDLQSLSSTPLTPEQSRKITFLRSIDWPVSRRVVGLPWMRVPFVEHPQQGLLVIELPERLMPGRYRLFWQFMTNGVIPGLFTLLLCIGLYRMSVSYTHLTLPTTERV